MEYKGLVDLHNHTTVSDGLLTPSELVRYAKLKGLKAIAITDHDNTDGIDEAVKAGEEIGIYVIPGIELNTQRYKKEIHLLGYYINKDLGWFQEILSKIRDERDHRAEKMVRNLRQIYGFDIHFDEVQKEIKDGGSAGRPHIARILVKKGIVKDIGEAFEKYIGTDSPAYVERYKLTPSEGIDIIKRANGVPVLAHPGLLYDDALVKEIIFEGVMGIEAYHSKHSSDDSERYVRLARERGLIVTAGSDCHGELVDGMPIVGDVAISIEVVNELYNAAKKNQKNSFFS